MAIKVPFHDFSTAYTELKVELDEAYRRFMESGWYVLGNEVTSFEQEYATYCEVKYCVGVGNGLDALHLALRAADCGAEDEVIVASNTYIATWLAVTQVGATVVPVEPDERTYNINPVLIEQSITKKTKVILSTNLYGQPCDYDSINKIAKQHGLIFITDNAQAQGACYKQRRVGGLADIECHSFYPSKNLGAFGEAGAVTTNCLKKSDRIRTLRNYGSRTRYINESVGFNSRLDELQAAFLRIKLRYLNAWNKKRNQVASTYTERLSSISSNVTLPLASSWVDHVWHLYVIQTPLRNLLQSVLKHAGVETLIHYPIPPHLQEAYSGLGYKKGSFPIAEKLSEQVLSLPIYPSMTMEQISQVVSVCENVG